MSRRNRMFTARTLVLGGLAAAAAAAALKNRAKVAGLIGARSSEPEPYSPPSSTATPPPAVSNYDAPGPPENTATPVPAPEPVVHEGGIDEEAEEAAAAAEAANIGGATPEYAPSTLGETVDEEDRPLEEAGEGIAEGSEQAEGDLADNAEPTAGEKIEAERQIDDVIEAQDDPTSGEIVEPHDHIHGDDEQQLSIDDAPKDSAPLQPETVDEGAPTAGGTASGTTSAAEKSAAVWRRPDEQPTAEQSLVTEPGKEDDAEDGGGDDGGSEWQTWSGRAVDR